MIFFVTHKSYRIFERLNASYFIGWSDLQILPIYWQCPCVYLDRVLVTTLAPPSVEEESWGWMRPGDAGAHPPLSWSGAEVRCQHWASRASTGPNTPPASPRPLHCTMAVPTLIILRSSSSQIPDKVTTSRIKWSNTMYLMSSVPPPWMSALSKAWYSQNLYPLENINNNIISNNDIKDYYKRLCKNINLNSYFKLLLYLWVVNWSNLHQSPHMIKPSLHNFNSWCRLVAGCWWPPKCGAGVQDHRATVQYSTVQYRITVPLYSTVQYSTVQYRISRVTVHSPPASTVTIPQQTISIQFSLSRFKTRPQINQIL